MSEILSPGDRVVCKVRCCDIVSSSEDDYDEKCAFDIIAINYQGWYLYVPAYMVIKSSVRITKKNYSPLGIDPKYIGEEAAFITGSCIVKISQMLQGMKCEGCQEWFEWAEANQSDGTLLCWRCRTYPFYK